MHVRRQTPSQHKTAPVRLFAYPARSCCMSLSALNLHTSHISFPSSSLSLILPNQHRCTSEGVSGIVNPRGESQINSVSSGGPQVLVWTSVLISPHGLPDFPLPQTKPRAKPANVHTQHQPHHAESVDRLVRCSAVGMLTKDVQSE